MQSYLNMWKNYAVFSGRSRRRDYWMATLFNVIISMVLYALIAATGYGIFVLLRYVYSLAILVPTFALIARRYHDIGKPGWHYLKIFIPIAGIFMVLIDLAKDSQSGENMYGFNPKESIDIAA